MTTPIYNPPLPYVGPIPGGVLTVGTLIRIQGTPHHTARCFAINLQCGPNVHPRDDIALHLSPVFSPPPRIVRNSIQAQQWGPEESHGEPFPLVAGQGFEILVLVEHEYKIAINGRHYAEFQHRIPIHRVTHLTMDGDTTISLVQFEGMPSAPMMPMSMPMPVAPPSGRVSPYGDARFGAPYPAQAGYPPPPGGAYYPPPAGVQPAYPGAGYPTAGYPAHGSGMQYVPHPADQKHSSGLGGMGTGLGAGLAAGAAALAGSSLLKHGMDALSSITKNMVKGHKAGLVPAVAGAALSSGLHHKSHGHKPKSSMPLPIGAGTLGTGLAVGATALAGAALAKKLKPKKMFKHKYKHGWKGWSSSSSSSSSSEEE